MESAQSELARMSIVVEKLSNQSGEMHTLRPAGSMDDLNKKKQVQVVLRFRGS